MSKTKSKPRLSPDDLRELCRELGLTPADELLDRARQADDPEAFLTSLAASNTASPDQVPAAPAPAAPPAIAAASLRSTSIAMPLGNISEGAYIPRHVEARLEPQQGRALKALLEGLDQAGSRLASGKRVASLADAVRWLLEQVTLEEA